MGLEREAKLSAPVGFALPDLGGEASTRTLDATYWDTPDLRMARDGITLRHRTGEGDPRWTLKLPRATAAGVLSRAEIDVEAGPAVVPPELARRVRAWVRTSSLGPVARLVTTRRAVAVPAGAEVVDDEVAVAGGEPFRELEVELAAGAPDELLDDLVARLVEAGATHGPQVPKLVRALGERAGGRPELAPVEVPDDPLVADVVTSVLADAVREARDGDLLVAGGDADEGVLAVRRGLRRARATIRLLGPVLDQERTEPLADAVSGLLDALVPARRAERLAATVAAVAPGSEAAAAVAAERRAAAAAAAAALDGDGWVRLLDDLVALAADPPLGPDAAAPAAEILPRVTAAAMADLDAGRDGAPADVRRLVTRARDAAELAALAVGAPAEALTAALADLRRALGDHVDALAAAGWAGADPGLADACRERAAAASGRWPAAWAAVEDRAEWLA